MSQESQKTTTEAAFIQALQAAWEEHWPQQVPRQVHYPLGEQPLTDYLAHWAKLQPEKTAIHFYGFDLSWSKLDQLSTQFAALLQAKGLVAGDRVAVYLPNCPQFHIAFFGILKAGCVHVPFNPMFTQTELAYELKDAGPKAMVAHDQLLPLVDLVWQESGLSLLLSTAFSDCLPAVDLCELPPGMRADRVKSVYAEELMHALKHEFAFQPTEQDLDALAALNYTGGTTGLPKGCMHSQRDMLYTAAVESSISATVGPEDTVINFWPVFWIAGQDVGIMLSVVSGASCVLMARWDPLHFMKLVEQYRATHAFMLVDSAVQVLEHEHMRSVNLQSLRETLVASFVKKLNVPYRKAWERLTGCVIREAAWGMTETHSFDTFTRGQQEDDFDLKQRQVYAGIPVPGTLFKIMPFGENAVLDFGQEGEICVKTPSLFKGYWKREDATDEAFTDGWLRTGDIGMISARGSLHFLGRKKEMLKVKGMSVFPAEIEAVLGQHFAVTGSGVIGREDSDKGQVPVAFVTIASEHRESVTDDVIVAFCRERLSIYKVPQIRIVDALPMTTTGKVRKDQLLSLL